MSMTVPNFCHSNAALFCAASVKFNIRKNSNWTNVSGSFGGHVALRNDVICIQYYFKQTDEQYSAIKARILSRFKVSHNGKVEIFVHHLELGYWSPSMLYRKISELIEIHAHDDYLKNIWLRRWLVWVERILSTSFDDLNKLAGMADKICESKWVCINYFDSGEVTQMPFKK